MHTVLFFSTYLPSYTCLSIHLSFNIVYLLASSYSSIHLSYPSIHSSIHLIYSFIHLIHPSYPLIHCLCIRPLPPPRPASHSITAVGVCQSMPRQVLPIVTSLTQCTPINAYDMIWSHFTHCHMPHLIQPKQRLLQARRNQRRICGKDLAFWRWRRWDPLVSLMAL
jgi:hypothetical protein